MPTDQERLASLKRAPANANPIGFVAILTRDLRWLIAKAESGEGKADKNGSALSSPPSTLPTTEIPHDAELN
jgi:hypothetical protein